MGLVHTKLPGDLTPEIIESYTDSTFFTYSEVVNLYIRFTQLDPLQNNVLTMAEFSFMEELVHNNFGRRFFEVFTENSDHMTFGQFLNFANAFCRRAPHKVKLSYAFKVFDINDDGVIGAEDIRDVVDLMVDNENKLSNEDKDKIVEYMLQELKDECYTDSLNKIDFIRMAKRVPSFSKRFTISIL